MKKTVFVLWLICTLLFVGCTQTSTDDGRYTVVCTSFAAYDWMKNICEGTDTAVVLLTEGGADVHSYQPSAKDILTMQNAELIVYIGGESDEWAADASSGGKSVGLMPLLEDVVKTEAYTAGFVGGETEEALAEKDEHIWLSLRLAARCVSALCDTMCKEDADHAEAYRANTEAYLEMLDRIDAQFEAVVMNGKTNVLVVADRFPLRYFADDYGLICYAAYPGCSAETGASFDTVETLAGAMDDNGLTALCVTETADGNIAEAVKNRCRAKDVRTVVFDAMQSTRIDAKRTYAGIMEENVRALEILLEAGE